MRIRRQIWSYWLNRFKWLDSMIGNGGGGSGGPGSDVGGLLGVIGAAEDHQY